MCCITPGFLNLKLVLLDSMATAANLHATAMARPSVTPGRVGVSVLRVIKGSTVRRVRNSFYRLNLYRSWDPSLFLLFFFQCVNKAVLGLTVPVYVTVMETHHATLWPACACVDQERWGAAVIQVGLRRFHSMTQYQISNTLKLKFLAKIQWTKNQNENLFCDLRTKRTTYYLSGRHVSEKLCLLGKILVYFVLFFFYKPHVTHCYGIKSVFLFMLSLYTESLWT